MSGSLDIGSTPRPRGRFMVRGFGRRTGCCSTRATSFGTLLGSTFGTMSGGGQVVLRGGESRRPNVPVQGDGGVLISEELPELHENGREVPARRRRVLPGRRRPHLVPDHQRRRDPVENGRGKHAHPTGVIEALVVHIRAYGNARTAFVRPISSPAGAGMWHRCPEVSSALQFL
jgi:hypothetical protein